MAASKSPLVQYGTVNGIPINAPYEQDAIFPLTAPPPLVTVRLSALYVRRKPSDGARIPFGLTGGNAGDVLQLGQNEAGALVAAGAAAYA
jgi:hypothetical protein